MSDQFQDGSAQVGSASLVSILSGFGMSSGPGVFMLRSMVVSSTTAIVFGLTSASLGALTLGSAAIPFIIGTSAGFVFGAYSHYRQCIVESATVLAEMPDVFHFHIRRTYPAIYRTTRFTNLWDDGVLAKSMSIGALFSASETLREIKARQEMELVEKYGTLQTLEKE